MWYWIIIFVLAIVLLAVLEESIYYCWHRYVYGKKHVMQRKWLRKIQEWLCQKARQRKDVQSEIQKGVDSP